MSKPAAEFITYRGIDKLFYGKFMDLFLFISNEFFFFKVLTFRIIHLHGRIN